LRGWPAGGHLDRAGEAGALPHRAKEQRRRSRLGREGDAPPPHRARKEQGRCRRAAEVGKERGTAALELGRQHAPGLGRPRYRRSRYDGIDSVCGSWSYGRETEAMGKGREREGIRLGAWVPP